MRDPPGRVNAEGGCGRVEGQVTLLLRVSVRSSGTS